MVNPLICQMRNKEFRGACVSDMWNIVQHHNFHSQYPGLLIEQLGGNHTGYIMLLLIDGVQINNFFVE